MLRYTLKRLAVGVLTLAALATITFFLMKIIPGSPFGGQLAQLSPEVREMLYAQYNLDKSIPEQFLIYLRNAITGEFGESMTRKGTPVVTIIARCLPATAKLGLVAFVMAITLGITLGIIAAFTKKRWVENGVMFIATIGVSVPSFLYAMLLMIVFVSSKIVVGRRASQQGMYIDLQTLAELEKERDRLEREVRERQEQNPIDWGSIRNLASNENALNERLRDDRGTNTAALKEAAAEAEARMRANREAYEEGLAEERAIRERRGREEGAERRDSKIKGRVTVSFSLTDPVRTSRWLEVPAYRCEGGGEVVVSITVNRAGEVTAARIEEGGDDCMREAALRAARMSLFNIDSAAPARQAGTITYIFIPQ